MFSAHRITNMHLPDVHATKTKAILYFLQTYCEKSPHIICEVFCSPVLSRLLLFLWSWLKVFQSYSQIKLSQLICCTATFRASNMFGFG